MPRKTSCSCRTTGERVRGIACGTAGTIINRQTRRKSVSCSTVPHLPETQVTDKLRHVRNSYVYCFNLGSIILSFDFLCVYTIINHQTRMNSPCLVFHLPETQVTDALCLVRNSCVVLYYLVLFLSCVNYHKHPNKKEAWVHCCSSLTGNKSN